MAQEGRRPVDTDMPAEMKFGSATLVPLAAGEALQLGAEHWEILQLTRSFYAEFQLSPANRPLIKYVAGKLGPEKGNSLHLNRLFKGTPAKLAAKLAGLPKPTNCL